MSSHLPVKVLKIKGLYRIIEAQGRIAKSVHGKPVDGGGHKDRATAVRQQGYINNGGSK